MDVKCYRKSFKSPKAGKGDKWVEDKITNTINCFDIGDIRTCEIICHEVQKDVNKESHFFETASIFEENWIERNTVNALRNHATGAGMGVLVQMDEKLIVLNDQGGAVMDVSYEKTATLCAQDHGHPPVVCIQGAGITSQNSQGSGISEGGGGIHSEYC